MSTLTFDTWAEYSNYLKNLPTDKDRIDALFNDDIVCLEEDINHQCSFWGE